MREFIREYLTPWGVLQARIGPQGILCAEFTAPPRCGSLQPWCTTAPAPLQPQGTPFQISVWQALQHIPWGEVRTYGQIAASIGKPQAYRAVAHAIACNPIALWIPCHRVIPANYGTGKYRWGAARKKAILLWEATIRLAQQPQPLLP